jgi:hypothetical protein
MIRAIFVEVKLVPKYALVKHTKCHLKQLAPDAVYYCEGEVSRVGQGTHMKPGDRVLFHSDCHPWIILGDDDYFLLRDSDITRIAERTAAS